RRHASRRRRCGGARRYPITCLHKPHRRADDELVAARLLITGREGSLPQQIKLILVEAALQSEQQPGLACRAGRTGAAGVEGLGSIIECSAFGRIGILSRPESERGPCINVSVSTVNFVECMTYGFWLYVSWPHETHLLAKRDKLVSAVASG